MLKGLRATLIMMDDFFPGPRRIIDKDILHVMEIHERTMNAPPTDQRLVHTLVTEVTNPKTKRNAAQWKKEQKMRRK